MHYPFHFVPMAGEHEVRNVADVKHKAKVGFKAYTPKERKEIADKSATSFFSITARSMPTASA